MALLLLGSRARAGEQVETSARVDVYVDDWVTVVMPSTRAVVRGQKLTVEGEYAIDALSGATPVITADAITSATSFKERRQSGGAAITATPSPTWSIGARYAGSHEPDYATHAVGLDAGAELLDRRARASFGWTTSSERVSLATGGPLVEHLVTQAAKLEWSHIVDRSTTVLLMANGRYEACGPVLGCQPNPYRYVAGEAAGAVVVAGRERHPQVRWRGTAGVRLSRLFGERTALHVAYRYYADTWSMRGHVLRASATQELVLDRLLLRVDGRLAAQGAAAFYRDTYQVDPGQPALPRWRSADRELSGVRDGTVSGRLAWTELGIGPLTSLTSSVRVSRMWFVYPGFSELPRRRAWLLGGGVDAAF